ncbi:MAG TPA: hypothetical protein ENK06_12415 [Gammaproteobacteria bacterium]|nr:hypothetical protein [Gammaproteobacteria bacterium]
MGPLSIITSLIKPAISGFLRWKAGEDKMEITRQEYELRLRQLESDIEIRLAEEMRKPDSEFRKFVMDYEGAAKDQTTFIKNLRSSVRPFITYWALIIITCVMFGWIDTDSLKANLDAIPPQLWQIFLAIFGFWFGGRALMQVAEAWKSGEVQKQKVESEGRAAEVMAKAKAMVKKADLARAASPVIVSTNNENLPTVKKKPQTKKDNDDYEWDDDYWFEE